MSVLITISDAVWTAISRTLAGGVAAAPTTASERLADSIWTYGTRTLTSGSGELSSPILVEVSKTSRTVTLSWNEATGGTAPYNYDIEQEQPSGSGNWVEVESDVTSPAVVDLLDPDTAYNHRLKTTDSGV